MLDDEPTDEKTVVLDGTELCFRGLNPALPQRATVEEICAIIDATKRAMQEHAVKVNHAEMCR